MNVFLKLCVFSAFLFFNPLRAEFKVGVVTSTRYVGEREVAWRIKIAGERLGWTVYLDEFSGSKTHKKRLDCVICMINNKKTINSKCYNYLTLFHPFIFLDEARKIKPFYEKFDGFLLTLDRETIEPPENKKFYSSPFYPTMFRVPYRELEFNDLVVMIPVWGNRLRDENFVTLYQLLSETGRAKFYGVNRHEEIISQGYMGSIPFDGVSVIDVLQRHGIVLVNHSNIHNEEGIPSARIFEAAAASALIISDENSFVKQHFGDSVFYIDTSLPAEEIFSQIQEHLKAIDENPEAAIEMAKRSHEIFIEKFTMEDQLLLLKKMHLQIIAEKK